MKSLALIILTFILNTGVCKSEEYQTSESFIHEIFTIIPEQKAIWVTRELKKNAEEIMGHELPLRLRYWQQAQTTVWILDEIGKEKPITAAIVIKESHIEKIRVLAFRESRGWEIRQPFFTDQFRNISLSEKKLSKQIDGISGATLSVRALKKVATLALFLHQEVMQNHDTSR